MSVNCKYFLPCGYCDKFDKACILFKNEMLTQDGGVSCNHNWEQISASKECVNATDIVTYFTYKCKWCGEIKKVYE